MNLVIALILVAIPASILIAGEVSGFYRFPDVNGDLVVFTSEGDLWAASLSGKSDVKRLTRHDGQEMYARISPDGKWIAFTGQYDGNSDVYVIPSTGGEPERLTYHSAYDEVVGWTEDGKSVIFRSYRYAAIRAWKLYTVGLDGGFPKDIGLDKGTRISFDPSSDSFAFTRLRREQRSWKRYKGGWAMDIWVGNMTTMKFDLITEFDGTDAYPMWVNDRIYYISDRPGRFNIFSMKPDGSDIKQHTRESTWDIRWPSTDGKTIVYQMAMDLWAYDIGTGKASKVNVSLPTDRIRARDRMLKNPTDYLESWSIPNSGKRMAFSARGEVFTFPVDKEGYIRRLTHSPGSHEKYVAFSPDGKTLAMMSDASGEDEIWLVPSDGKEEAKQLTKGGKMTRFGMDWSPDGKYLVFADKGKNLWIADAENGKLTNVSKNAGWEIHGYEWSSDSKWIAWTQLDENWSSDVFIYNIDSKKTFRFDKPMTQETNFSWEPDGKYLYIMSENYFNPVIGNMDETFIYDTTTKLYVVLLAEDTDNPFASELVEAFEAEEDEEDGDDDEDDDKDDDDGEGDEEDDVEPIVLDLDGLAERIYPLPIDAGNYGGLYGVSGKVYFTSSQRRGMKAEGKKPKGVTLNVFDLEEEEVEVVTETCMGFGFSPDRKKMYVKTGPTNFVVMDAGSDKIPEEDGHVSLSGWSFEFDPGEEWNQILREIWRWQRDFFYDPGMHGVDWNGIWKQYSALLPRVSNRDELNDLIAEMIGELNIGHAYIWGGDVKGGEKTGTGLLGADLEPGKSGAYKISYVPYGDGWGDEPVSPLKGMKTGEYITAVDGVELKAGDNIYEYLVDKSGREVLLTVSESAKGKDSRDVLVKPMGSDRRLRYLDWVRDRREYVDKVSNGKIAYVHLPDMMGMGLSMWGRMYLPQANKEGLIVDVRYNGGGFVAEMILSQLERTLWCRGKGRETPLYKRPNSAFYGPIAAICNHETGSDGETFSEGFKRLELGTLFGTRTWGGWVGIRGGRGTVDKGGNTQPEFSGWGAFDGKWLIEGPGVTPDVEVLDNPAQMIRMEDPQLDAALHHVLTELKDTKKWPPLHEPPAYPKKPLKINHMK